MGQLLNFSKKLTGCQKVAYRPLLIDNNGCMRTFKMSKNVKKGTKCLIILSKLTNGKKWEEPMLPHMLPSFTWQQKAPKYLCFLVPDF